MQDSEGGAVEPFAGLKVITVARVYAAPFAAYQLALHGAEVIGVEQPGKGDSTRSNSGAHAKALADRGMGPAFLAHSSNKKSITLDLRHPQGQEVFRRLARDADIIIENLRGGDMARSGLDYAAISAFNPRIIYASLTGWGQTGPKRRDAAIDMVVQAATGMMSVTGTPQSGPLRSGITVIDYMAGYNLTAAIAIALYQRERTGEGQYLDISLLETALAGMSAQVSDVHNAGGRPGLLGNRSMAMMPVSDSLRCGDDGYIMVAASNAVRRAKFFAAIGREDLPREERFATPELLRKNADALYAEIEAHLKSRSAAEWEEILNRGGVACMRIASIAEGIQSEQVQARGLYHRFEQVPWSDRPVTVPLSPLKMSKVKARVHSPPPLLGEHTDSILRDAGYTDAEIKALREAGAV
jgi:crotonobetainyl-CoA:carnitine CoA-transferase CaiB-like acyl-CoA transferase